MIALVVIFYPSGSEMSAEQLLAEVSDEALLEYIDLNEISELDLIDGVDESALDALWEDELQELQLDDSNLDFMLDDIELNDLELDNLL